MTPPGRDRDPRPTTAPVPAAATADTASVPSCVTASSSAVEDGDGDDAAAVRRRVARAALRFLAGAVTGLLIVLLLGAAQAQAAGYRYWSFWRWSDGGWAYQQQGPAVHVPVDGEVEGWRFAVSPDGGQQAARPGTAGDFAAVCAGTPAEAGRKRVAVVLDFGGPADAPGRESPPEPRTACAVVAPRASSAEVLATVAPPLRYDGNGLLCAIAGYPRAGCGEQLGGAARPSGTADPSAGTGPIGATGAVAAGSTPGAAGPALGVGGGLALVLAVAAGARWQARRRR
ncbi:SCO2322 family protein [Kitasatospora sp. NPDC094019]|uniref:SCO2322 family protein n=1 Tax=Kitasatospora sp. NPDC094019 TaxID=3364091 RepID=UPI0038077889